MRLGKGVWRGGAQDKKIVRRELTMANICYIMSVQNRFQIDPIIRPWGWFSVVVVVFVVAIGK
jgi:hypothetical protein